MDIKYTPEDIADALGRPRPTQEQSAIISSPLVPRLVVAGAGSGKTATMVDRVVWLVANGLVRADQVLGVTFTRKAAGELRERMRMRLEELRRQGMLVQNSSELEPISDPSVLTYHSYANTLVANYGLRLGIEQDAQMLGGAQSWQLVAQLVEHVDPKMVPPDAQAKSSIIEGVIKLSSECAEHLLDPQQVIDWCQKQVDMLEKLPLAGRNKGADRNKLVSRLTNRIFYAQLVQMYSRLKKTMQVMDYGDLIALAARIAREIPQAAASERDRYRVVLLDEFQDTSHAQMELFSDLFGARRGAAEHPVMAVGDPKQSIYGFRGASDGQLFSFYDYFPTQDREASYLTVAWRNDTAILDAANTIASPLQTQPDWVRSNSKVLVPDLAARPEPGVGRVELGRYLTDTNEAEALAAAISARRAAYAGRAQQEMPTMAVLCKKRAQMGAISRAFDSLGIPYQIVGLGGLLDTPEVIDMVATLRVLADPGRSDALMRLLAGARWRLGVSDLLAFSDWASFMVRRREEAIRKGIAEDLFSDLSPEEIAAEEERLRTQTVSDIVDSASLIEALDDLPAADWVSAAGRSISPEGLRRLQLLAGELAELRSYLADDLSTLLFAIERTINLDIELAVKPGISSDSARRNIDAFHDVAAQYAASAPRINASLQAGVELLRAQDSGEVEAADSQDAGAENTASVRFSLSSAVSGVGGVNGFLAWLDAAAAQESGLEMSAEAPRHDVVQILTVHASKGLEWDHVYIPGLNQSDFPLLDDPRWTQNSMDLPWSLRGDRNFLPAWRDDFDDVLDLKDHLDLMKEQALEHRLNEERRLAYVAYTRSRSLLVLTSSVWQGTKAKLTQPSTFWWELQEKAVDLKEELKEEPVETDPNLPRLITSISSADVAEENPQQAAITTALWPFDPIDGPVLYEWSSQEALEAAHDNNDFSDEAVDARNRKKIEAAELFAVSRRARVERAAANILRGGLEEGFEADSALLASAQVLEGPSLEDWYQEAELLLNLYNLQEDSTPFELPKHLSASDLVGLAGDAEAVVAQMIRPMPQKPGIAARQGNLFHSWVESHFEKSAMLDFDEEDYADESYEEALNLPQLQENFLKSKWAQVQPWAVEYPLETPLEGVSIRGRVDAIYRWEDEEGRVRWELVDWKTGRSPKTAQEKRVRSIQLASYRLAFSRLQQVPLEDISGTFFYVAEGKTLEVEKLAEEKELIRLIKNAQKIGGQR